MSELLDAFWSYEQALGANDLAGLDHWFLDAPDTVRAEGSMVLSGHAAISTSVAAATGEPRPVRSSASMRCGSPRTSPY